MPGEYLLSLLLRFPLFYLRGFVHLSGKEEKGEGGEFMSYSLPIPLGRFPETARGINENYVYYAYLPH